MPNLELMDEDQRIGYEWNNNDYHVSSTRDSYNFGHGECGDDHLDEDEKFEDDLPFSDYRVEQLQKFDQSVKILELMVKENLILNFDKTKLWNFVWNRMKYDEVTQTHIDVEGNTQFSEVINCGNGESQGHLNKFFKGEKSNNSKSC